MIADGYKIELIESSKVAVCSDQQTASKIR